MSKSSQANSKPTTLLSQSLLSDGQNEAIDRLYGYDETLLIGDMGVGKTVIALTAAAELIAESHLIDTVLVVGTLKSINEVWAHEHKKWAHLKHLRVLTVTGSLEERMAALMSPDGWNPQIVCINFDNLPWLLKAYPKTLPYQGLIIDELSKLKKPGGVQFKSLRHKIKQFKWRVGMTGTPVAEDFTGLFGQMLMVDGGRALGRNKQRYLEKYFEKADWQGYSWKLRDGSAERITKKIAGAVHMVPDYRHELPRLNIGGDNDIMVELSAHGRKMYDGMCKDMILEIEGSEYVAENAAVLSGKLQQIANGFLYRHKTLGTNGYVADTALNVHNAKIHALQKVLTDRPTIIFYWFKEDLKALLEAIPGARVLGGDQSAADTAQVIKDWSAGRITRLLLQPRSAGHGLNLMYGGHDMVGYSMLWSNDLYLQIIARLWRRGQKHEVNVTRLIAKDTVDELIAERLTDKAGFDGLLRKHLAARSGG